MNKSDTMGGTGGARIPGGQELRRLLKAGQTPVNVINIVQVGDRLMAPGQAARLAPAILRLLSRSAGSPEPTDDHRPGRFHPSPTREGVFRFDGGDTWEIGLDGRVGWYRDALGLHQLHHLLQRPKQAVPVIELAEVRGQQVVMNQLCSEDMADGNAFAQWKGEIDRLRDELELAKATGNGERQSEVEIEMEALVRHIRCARSRSGVVRRLGDQGNLLRNRVCYTLKQSLRKIISQAPGLGEHLRAGIKLGYECGYFPLTSVDWTLKHTLG